MQDELSAEYTRIQGAGGDEVQAYLAAPADAGPFGGVVVIHHMPGFDEATREITRRFAAHGYLAICPNLYWREAPGATAEEAAATVRAAGGVPDDRLVGDVGGAATHLRRHAKSNGRVGVIGYCSGGRQSLLAACSLELQAAVDCYGGFAVEPVPEGLGLSFSPVVGKVGSLSCPLLGLFGAEDQHPAPENVEQLAEALRAAGKDFTFHTFENAGHAFFATNRDMYRPEAAAQGWERIWEFFGEHLAPDPA